MMFETGVYPSIQDTRGVEQVINGIHLTYSQEAPVGLVGVIKDARGRLIKRVDIVV